MRIVYLQWISTLNGQPVDKETLTINEILALNAELRVIGDPALPNTTGNPTVKEYLEREATEEYIVVKFTQANIITQFQEPGVLFTLSSGNTLVFDDETPIQLGDDAGNPLELIYVNGLAVDTKDFGTLTLH